MVVRAESEEGDDAVLVVFHCSLEPVAQLQSESRISDEMLRQIYAVGCAVDVCKDVVVLSPFFKKFTFRRHGPMIMPFPATLCTLLG